LELLNFLYGLVRNQPVDEFGKISDERKKNEGAGYIETGVGVGHLPRQTRGKTTSKNKILLIPVQIYDENISISLGFSFIRVV
jgi:hypothetical protein